MGKLFEKYLYRHYACIMGVTFTPNIDTDEAEMKFTKIALVRGLLVAGLKLEA